jgi:XTP/dITP diphosphohydrolase
MNGAPAPRQRDRPPLLLATRSEDKAVEIRHILAPALRREIISLRQAGIAPSTDEDGIEAFPTFHDNAIAKARFFAGLADLPVLADDSGLCVDALGGAPGVLSRRFSGRDDLSGAALDRANNLLLLQRLSSVPPYARAAHYTCAAVLLEPGRRPITAIASISGSIAPAPAGHAGFGYDPVFFFPPLGKTLAQLDPEMKNRYSHRGRAFRTLAALCYAVFQG